MAGEELAPARARKGEDVLDVGHGGRHRAEDGWVERPTPPSEEQEGSRSAGDLEPARGDVVMGHAVAEQVRERPERERALARAAERPGESSGGDVERDDHGPEGGRMAETNDTPDES